MAAATEEAPSEELPWELHPDKSIRFEAHGGLWEGAVERVEACHLASSGACIDAWGEFSAKCQGLRRPITSVELLRGPFADHAAFVVLEGSSARVVGIVKTGQKHLYLRDRKGGSSTGGSCACWTCASTPACAGAGSGSPPSKPCSRPSARPWNAARSTDRRHRCRGCCGRGFQNTLRLSSNRIPSSG
jgi:hypothetical protein